MDEVGDGVVMGDIAPRVLTHKGRPLTELSREELLVACTWAYTALEDERRFHRENQEMEQFFADSRKAIMRKATGL